LPKSACTLPPTPIDAISCAEFDATGSASTFWFHGFEVGKTGQAASVGGEEVAPVRETRSAAAASSLTAAA
jgi:hypothetical protein